MLRVLKRIPKKSGKSKTYYRKLHHYTFVAGVPGREVSEQETTHSSNIVVKVTSFATYCKETQYTTMYKSTVQKNLVAQNLITSKTFRKIHPHINFFIIVPSRSKLSP
jgi:hypothetical protein